MDENNFSDENEPIQPIMPTDTDAFENNSDFSFKLKLYSLLILKIFISCIAIYLSWQCNQSVNIFLKIIYGIFTAIFSEIYIIYYGIYRLYMGNKCT